MTILMFSKYDVLLTRNKKRKMCFPHWFSAGLGRSHCIRTLHFCSWNLGILSCEDMAGKNSFWSINWSEIICNPWRTATNTKSHIMPFCIVTYLTIKHANKMLSHNWNLREELLAVFCAYSDWMGRFPLGLSWCH